jgi:hypothetical protein
MDAKHNLERLDEGRTVYVRPVDADDLPDEMRAQVGELKTLYAVHNAEGERLAVVKDRNLAFMLARQNDLAPVTVH